MLISEHGFILYFIGMESYIIFEYSSNAGSRNAQFTSQFSRGDSLSLFQPILDLLDRLFRPDRSWTASWFEQSDTTSLSKASAPPVDGRVANSTT